MVVFSTITLKDINTLLGVFYFPSVFIAVIEKRGLKGVFEKFQF